ncbi:iron chelate uptake ABC transporter family permease subunit [Streptomyces sp. NPDC002838]|uniref:iron chelate uptake ABC transporter family permease subunit n=1 Tax=Streptomyces sp. NPDC002838 TaxID=3154436 RepID=UPI003326BD09
MSGGAGGHSRGGCTATATCTGALLVVAVDYASQRVHQTAQLPVGVLTAVIGGLPLGPLPRRQRRAGRI